MGSELADGAPGHCSSIKLAAVEHLACAAHWQAFSDVFPHLVTATNVPRLVKVADVDWSGVDAAFCCLPHATTQEILASLPHEVRVAAAPAACLHADQTGGRGPARSKRLSAGVCQSRAGVGSGRRPARRPAAQVRVVDLSADFRLRNVDTYAQWCACPLPARRATHRPLSFCACRLVGRSVPVKAKSAWMYRAPDPSEAFRSCPGQRAAGCTYPAGSRTLVCRLPRPAGAQVRRPAQSAGAAEGGRVRHHRAAPRGRAVGAPGGQPRLLPDLGAAAAGAAAPGTARTAPPICKETRITCRKVSTDYW